MKNKMIVLVTLHALLLAAGVTGCKRKAHDQAQLEKVRVVLDWTPNTNHTGLYVAQALGYFAEQGLEVQIIQPGENTAEKIVASGQAEFGVSYQESVTIARAESLPIRSIAAIIQHNTSGFAALARSNIKSPKDFEFKRYGSSGWPSELAILRQVMHAADAFTDSIQIVSGVYDFFSTIGKDIDLAWIYYGWDGVQAKLRGIDITFIPVRDLDPVFDFYTPVLICNEELINLRPETVKVFMAAVAKGYNYCIAQPAQAAKILLKAVPELDPALVEASLLYLKDQFKADAPRWGYQKPEVWQRFAQWMHQKRIIPIGVIAEDAYTNEFLP